MTQSTVPPADDYFLKLPPLRQAQVFIDFDGTITQGDFFDDLITGHSINDSWRESERRWLAGEMGTRQCLTEQLTGVRISDADLLTLLDAVKLDPGFVTLVTWLQQLAVPLAVLSDGIDRFINHTLEKAGVRMTIRSNSIDRTNPQMKLLCPFSKSDCETASAHCKCSSMLALLNEKRKSIYIGDGRSDLCAARKADFVFAKGALAAAFKVENRRFVIFRTLNDVMAVMENFWGK